MKIRSIEELNDKVDSEFAWRRKELTTILAQVNQSSGINTNTAIRGAIVLLYAHWEGFIKAACEYYLVFVSTKKLKNSELKNCFLAISFKKDLDKSERAAKNTIHSRAISNILENVDKVSDVPYRGVIDTGSNLNSDVLIEILSTIGLDPFKYRLKFHLIDSSLLKSRNEIAHGQYLGIEKEDYKLLYDDVIAIITDIKICICNAAAQEQYKK